MVDIINTIAAELSRKNVEDVARRIFDLEGAFTYPNFKRSAAFCASRLKETGASDVRTIAHRADGKSASMDTIMPKAWDATEGRLEVVAPTGFSGYVLADTQETFLCLANRCAPTPPGGIVAGVVSEGMFKNGADIRGKLVLVSSLYPQNVRQEVVERGGVGIISSAMPDVADNPDVTFWNNGWSHGPGWYQTAEEKPLVCFSITPRREAYLRSLLASEERVLVRALVKSRLYIGSIDTVTGCVPGESEDELLLMAHIYEPFANDNATSASGIIEIIRTIKALTDSKRLPPLKRSIRVIISNELFGFSAYLADYIKEHNAIAALNIDGISIDHRVTGQPLNLIMNPASQPFFGDLLLASMFRDHFAETDPARRVATARGCLIGDTFPADNTIGIPTNWIWQPEAQCWHTTLNDFSRTDWVSTMSILTLAASYIYFLASADDDGVSWLIENAAIEGKMSVYETARRLMGSDVGLSSEKVRQSLSFVSDWESGRVRSVYRLGINDAQRARIEEISGEIADIAVNIGERICKQIPSAEPPPPIDRGCTRGLVYTRLTVGMPHSLARVPFDERVSPPLGALEALNWMDGHRDLLQIACLVEEEIGESLDDRRLRDMVGYFALLEKYGYVEAK